jgi:dihydrofolate reductase
MLHPTKNKVFIATSLDGYIADSKGKIDFLYSYPDPADSDMGYAAFMKEVDAMLMGRKTLETVLGFGIEWPYTIPVFVWSSTFTKVPAGLEDKVHLVSGTTKEVLNAVHSLGHSELYIDGGQTIQSFLQEDLIDEMIITTVPILLGAGIRLFGKIDSPLHFSCIESNHFSNGLGQYKLLRQCRS